MTFRNGLASLLRPEDSVVVLIDHQPYQLANLNSHDPQAVVNNATALAKAAKPVFDTSPDKLLLNQALATLLQA